PAKRLRSHLREAEERARCAHHCLNDKMNEQTNPKPGPDPNFEDERESGEPAALELGSVPTLDVAQAKLVLEAALLSSSEPLTVLQLKRLFAGEIDADTLRRILDEMRGEWEGRAIEL